MRVIKTIPALRRIIKKIKLRNKTIGFVPTMGALHEGHLSLLRKCRRENDIVILSIFVNPKQFGPAEDFHAYPRQEKKDNSLAKKVMVDIIFYPSEKEMYPPGFLINFEINRIAKGLCGASRPGHFQGVATIIAKLLNVITPDTLYLGQKDAQQVAVLKQLVADLNFDVSIRVCPIVRERDGLAMSSRNRYLTIEQRAQAPVLFRALQAAKKLIHDGERQSGQVVNHMRQMIETSSSGVIEYIACVDEQTFVPIHVMKGNILIALAVHFGKTRLIDNTRINLK